MLGMNPITLLELLGQPEFQRGLLVGGAGLAAVLVVRKLGWLMTWGFGAFAALSWVGVLRSAPATPGWALPVTVVIALAGTWAFRVLLSRARAWSVGLTFALWVLGVWGTVPDTERAIVTMGVLAGMLPALWPGLKVRVGWHGAGVAIAALGFVAVTDGATRTGAMIGSFGMVGMALVAGLSARIVRKRQFLSPWWLVASQAVHVIVSGRVAGQTMDAGGALTIVILSSLVTGAGLAWGVRGLHTPPSTT
jgi:hypothetical protein